SHVLQVVGASRCVSHECLRGREVVLRVRISRLRRKYVDAMPVPPQTLLSLPPTETGRIQLGTAFPGTVTLRPCTRGSCSGSFMNSPSCCVSGCTSSSVTTAGAFCG